MCVAVIQWVNCIVRMLSCFNKSFLLELGGTTCPSSTPACHTYVVYSQDLVLVPSFCVCSKKFLVLQDLYVRTYICVYVCT